MSLGPFFLCISLNRIRVEQRRQPPHPFDFTLRPHSLALTHPVLDCHSSPHPSLWPASFSQKLSLKCVTDSSGRKIVSGLHKEWKMGQIGACLSWAALCQHGRWGGGWGGAHLKTLVRGCRAGRSVLSHPGSWVLMSGMDGRSFDDSSSQRAIAKAMRHCLQSPKSRGRAAAQPGTAWVLWELSDMGRGGDRAREQPTEDSLPTWHLRNPMVCLKADERDTQQTFRKGFETSLLGESWLTNAYSSTDKHTEHPLGARHGNCLVRRSEPRCGGLGWNEPTYYLGQVT